MKNKILIGMFLLVTSGVVAQVQQQTQYNHQRTTTRSTYSDTLGRGGRTTTHTQNSTQHTTRSQNNQTRRQGNDMNNMDRGNNRNNMDNGTNRNNTMPDSSGGQMNDMHK